MNPVATTRRNSAPTRASATCSSRGRMRRRRRPAVARAAPAASNRSSPPRGSRRRATATRPPSGASSTAASRSSGRPGQPRPGRSLRIPLPRPTTCPPATRARGSSRAAPTASTGSPSTNTRTRPRSPGGARPNATRAPIRKPVRRTASSSPRPRMHRISRWPRSRWTVPAARAPRTPPTRAGSTWPRVSTPCAGSRAGPPSPARFSPAIRPRRSWSARRPTNRVPWPGRSR